MYTAVGDLKRSAERLTVFSLMPCSSAIFSAMFGVQNQKGHFDLFDFLYTPPTFDPPTSRELLLQLVLLAYPPIGVFSKLNILLFVATSFISMWSNSLINGREAPSESWGTIVLEPSLRISLSDSSITFLGERMGL